MRISDEIREWCNLPQAYGIPCDELLELADRIDREMIELPKDRNGMPIHNGDKMYLDDCKSWQNPPAFCDKCGARVVERPYENSGTK